MKWENILWTLFCNALSFFVFINLACIIYFSMQDPVFYDLTTQGECDLTHT